MQRPDTRFFRLIDAARLPERAERSANGTLPTRATRYCDAVTSATAYGWHVFSPMAFSLLWDGFNIFWTYGTVGEWLPLAAAQFPNFAQEFDRQAPPEAAGCSPPFLTALPEAGLVQIWTGLIAQTAPGWSLLVRAPVNRPGPGGAAMFEGIVETDRWFGPLFVNFRLARTNTPIAFDTETPLAQLQPLPRQAYDENTLDAFSNVDGLERSGWDAYLEAIVRPNDDPTRRPGAYAVAARKRRRGACPFSAATA